MTRRTIAALRVEHREARADLLGEREQVELDAELAVVARLGLLEAVQVLVERLLRLPRGAVDALEHRALLVAAPVRARDLRELERAEPLGRRHVRAAAQVDELDVGRRRRCGTRETPLSPPTSPASSSSATPVRTFSMISLLVRLVGEHRERVVVGRPRRGRTAGRPARSRASRASMLAEVVVGEVRAVGQLEVVVEAVGDRRADRVLRAREEVASPPGPSRARSSAAAPRARRASRR